MARELVDGSLDRVVVMPLTAAYSRVQANAYDPFRERVEKAARGRQFAFASWFPEGGRVYLPFEPPEGEGQEGVDQDVREVLEEAGYTIVDYRQGLAEKTPGRPYRIGKLLQALYQKEVKELEIQRGDLSAIKFQSRQKSTDEFWTELLATFQNSPYRAHATGGSSGYLVVISSDIHDIGAMSTGRDWTSCMNLGGGVHASDVYCEVKEGGFVAYLIKEADREIRRPLARIAIRRFASKKGQSLAIPEDTVYGNEIKGFPETVQRWLDSKQGKINPGVFYRRGGEYSDSHQDVIIQGDQTGRGLLRMLRFGLSDRWNRRRIPYVQAAMDGILASKARFKPALLRRFAALVFDPENHIEGGAFAERYPEYVTQEAYDRFPDFIKDRIDKRNPQFRDGRLRQTVDLLDQGLDIENPALGLNTDQKASYGELGKVQDLLGKFDLIRPLTEKYIKQLVQFGRDVIARVGLGGVGDNMVRGVIHQLSMGNADTPTVVRFYQELLPHLDQLGVDRFGLALARLGINGTPFLPFLREFLQQKIEGKKGWNHEKDVERVRYIIDSIENGSGRSDRFDFF